MPPIGVGKFTGEDGIRLGKQKKQSYVQGALILSVAVMISKIVGALFKIPLQMMSQVAFGYFNTAYEIYVPISTICHGLGLPIAVSRMVSESITLKRYRECAWCIG